MCRYPKQSHRAGPSPYCAEGFGAKPTHPLEAETEVGPSGATDEFFLRGGFAGGPVSCQTSDLAPAARPQTRFSFFPGGPVRTDSSPGPQGDPAVVEGGSVGPPMCTSKPSPPNCLGDRVVPLPSFNSCELPTQLPGTTTRRPGAQFLAFQTFFWRPPLKRERPFDSALGRMTGRPVQWACFPSCQCPSFFSANLCPFFAPPSVTTVRWAATCPL